MVETVLESRSKRGMRRRGHLLKGLRSLANDPKATPKQRLEACKMLFALETNPDREDSIPPSTPRFSNDFSAVLAKIEQNGAA
jgi:hypothetical protein